jgi:hypothetical protein
MVFDQLEKAMEAVTPHTGWHSFFMEHLFRMRGDDGS